MEKEYPIAITTNNIELKSNSRGDIFEKNSDKYGVCCIRSGGEFTEKALFLNEQEYTFELARDKFGALLLIPTKKIIEGE